MKLLFIPDFVHMAGDEESAYSTISWGSLDIKMPVCTV